MKMLLQIEIPHEPFNSMVRDGTVGGKIQQILGEIKAEAVYFSNFEGRRGLIMVVDVPERHSVPALAEPWFLVFGATVQFRILMTPEDLGKAGLDAIGKKWG